jgi:hypothetical protein
VVLFGGNHISTGGESGEVEIQLRSEVVNFLISLIDLVAGTL